MFQRDICHFLAEYAMTDMSHKDFTKQAENDAGLIEVYKDEEAIFTL
jgi:hypothetical protein